MKMKLQHRPEFWADIMPLEDGADGWRSREQRQSDKLNEQAQRSGFNKGPRGMRFALARWIGALLGRIAVPFWCYGQTGHVRREKVWAAMKYGK